MFPNGQAASREEVEAEMMVHTHTMFQCTAVLNICKCQHPNIISLSLQYLLSQHFILAIVTLLAHPVAQEIQADTAPQILDKALLLAASLTLAAFLPQHPRDLLALLVGPLPTSLQAFLTRFQDSLAVAVAVVAAEARPLAVVVVDHPLVAVVVAAIFQARNG
jgi:hypothetical protein